MDMDYGKTCSNCGCLLLVENYERGMCHICKIRSERKKEEMTIHIKEHLYTPHQKVIEIIDDKGLVATIIPKHDEIVVISKWYRDVIVDSAFPPKLIIKIDKTLQLNNGF